MKRVFLLLIATMLFAVTFGTANATVTFVTDRSSLGGNDYVNWGVLGPVNTFVSSPFSISSQAGLGMTVSLPTDQLTFGRVDQGSPSGGGGWFGNFAVGDKLLWTSPGIWNLNNGPITILFNSPVFAAGTQIHKAGNSRIWCCRPDRGRDTARRDSPAAQPISLPDIPS